MNHIIIFPTDTVYGMGTPYLNKEGLKKIYEIKGRDFNKPIAVLVSNIDQVKQIGLMDESIEIILQNFWPGALTIILNSTPQYFEVSGEKTIGVRMPNHPLALELIEKLGPLKTTSVNQSNEAPLNDYELILKTYGHLVDKVYPNDLKLTETSSTVIDFTKEELIIIRQGDVTLKDIQNVLNK
ncbi:L-threonylcarbamoyladenylate synthase [Acholeplasma granularum]|uniref:L-threonylcarbamoyladenylate synthase n=1 Tax=Acholeplasma granularum TaxID=264635 RepID=UPI00046FF5A2|nr:L-threonylcarbamoyladenylate synthase [Acholeplasma granularum]